MPGMKGFFTETELQGESTFVSTIPKCGLCKLYQRCKSPKMPVDGKGKRKIMLLAEAPGADEDEQGKPLVDKAGQLLQRMLAKVDIDMRKDCWMTNSLICRPENNKIPNKKMVQWCRPNVFNAIKELKPEIVICFGEMAVRSLIGHLWKENVGGIGRWVGFHIPNLKPNMWIASTYHPAYLLRLNDPVLELHFLNHLKAAVSLKGRPWKNVPNYEENIQIIEDPSCAAEELKNFRARKPKIVAVDYETNMLKPDGERAEIVCCSVSDGETTLVYPWTKETREQTGEIWFDKTIGKIASHLKFEHRWTYKEYKRSVRNWVWDTMQAAHVLDNRKPPITGLKFQAFMRLGQASYETIIEPYLKAPGSNRENKIKKIELDRLLKYCGTDALLEVLVAVLQMKEIGLDVSDKINMGIKTLLDKRLLDD